MNFYDFILKNRIKLIQRERWNNVIGKFRERETFDINLEDFWMHGMSTYIAQIINTTRQNVDRYVSLGRIKESRTMDRAIYELLGEEIW